MFSADAAALAIDNFVFGAAVLKEFLFVEAAVVGVDVDGALVVAFSLTISAALQRAKM